MATECGPGAGAGELDGLLHGGGQGWRVGALYGAHGVAVVEDKEGGHGADIVLLGYVALVVDVDLAEGDLFGLGIFGR